MDAAEHFGDKSDTVADLDLRSLYELSASSTPSEVRESVVARVEAGERFTPVQVKSIVSDAKEALREDRKPAKKKTPSQQSYQKRIAAKDARERKEWAEKDARRKAAAQALVAFLRDRLGEGYGEFKALVKDVDLSELRQLLAA